ncbi:uncharacterized protein BdWA1_003676 [Babesia duncani]|uniref:Uncharacterized protein n=1 Tax=Babesia duncani TaxID=323732 RepID=A0AAD9UMG2_9APIC|nr:hypothetical protein BdWA1_003676 [Babesia duncani]
MAISDASIPRDISNGPLSKFDSLSPRNHEHDAKSHIVETAVEAEQLAEVVLVTTSLGSIKKQFFQSKRAQHLLDCKNIVYYLVDANRDISVAMS